MNISSVVVSIKNRQILDEVVCCIKEIDKCSVVASRDDKIVILIDSDSLECELQIYKLIEALKGVNSVAMIYSYQDLDDDINRANNNDIGNLVRQVDEKDARDVVYNGHIKYSF